MEKRYFFISILFTFILLTFLDVSAVVDEVKINTFKERYGSDWIISWNEVTDTPYSIIGSSYDLGVSIINTKEKAGIVATKFFFENSNFFKMKSDNIRLLSVEQGNNEWYIEYQQQYNGIPIENSEVGMTIDKKGNLLMIGSNYHNDINIDITPKIKKKDAIEMAKKYLNFDDTSNNKPDFINETVLVKFDKIKNFIEKNITIQIPINKIKKEINSTLVILSEENGESYDYRLAWKIRLYSTKPLIHKELFIDTQTGQILKERNLVLDNFNIDGYTSGYIYPQHHYDPTQLKTFIHLKDFLVVWDEDLLR